MLLTVQRQWFSDNSTCGEMLLNGRYFCFTLEPPNRKDKPNCIPADTYSLIMAYSPKHKMYVPHVENVKGYDEIEVHPGNFPTDTLGCCLVGETHETDFVGVSQAVFKKLIATIAELVPNTSDELRMKESTSIQYIGGTTF